MSEKRYTVPEGMLEAALQVAPGGSETWSDWLPRALEAALRWFVEDTLHESNVQFHQAILQRATERYPTHPFERVAWEYGVSFARQYIAGLFAPDPEQQVTVLETRFGRIEIDERVPPGEIRLHKWSGPTLVRDIAVNGYSDPDEPIRDLFTDYVTHSDAVREAYRRGRESR